MRYAERGQRIFPCLPGTKIPAANRGVLSASNDPERVGRFWASHPGHNIGLATGHPGGVDVVDIDVKTVDGMVATRQLVDAGLLRGSTAEIRTPSGGTHLWYPAAVPAQRNSTDAKHGIDFRSLGGYVLVPPSVVDGNKYEFVNWRPITEGSPVDWQSIRAFLNPPPEFGKLRDFTTGSGLGSVQGVIAWMATRTTGERNQSLYWCARRLSEHGATEAEWGQLAQAARGVGLESWEVDRTMESARKAAE
jgi:hypothetical protein